MRRLRHAAFSLLIAVAFLYSLALLITFFGVSYPVWCDFGDRSTVYLYSREEYEAVVRALEARGARYTPWGPHVPAGRFSFCGNLLEDGELQALLGRRWVLLETWRPLLFPSPLPWLSLQPWRPQEGAAYVSFSTALAVTYLAFAGGLYASWRLGRAKKPAYFAAPYAPWLAFMAAGPLRLAPVDPQGVLLSFLVFLWPAAAYPAAFLLGLRRPQARRGA